LGAVAVALAVASADPAAAQQAKAGVLTCDVSAGIGLIIGSQKTVSCVFSPDLPGPGDPYVGSMTKFGLDIGVTAGGVITSATACWIGATKPTAVNAATMILTFIFMVYSPDLDGQRLGLAT